MINVEFVLKCTEVNKTQKMYRVVYIIPWTRLGEDMTLVTNFLPMRKMENVATIFSLSDGAQQKSCGQSQSALDSNYFVG